MYASTNSKSKSSSTANAELNPHSSSTASATRQTSSYSLVDDNEFLTLPTNSSTPRRQKRLAISHWLGLNCDYDEDSADPESYSADSSQYKAKAQPRKTLMKKTGEKRRKWPASRAAAAAVASSSSTSSSTSDKKTCRCRKRYQPQQAKTSARDEECNSLDRTLINIPDTSATDLQEQQSSPEMIDPQSPSETLVAEQLASQAKLLNAIQRSQETLLQRHDKQFQTLTRRQQQLQYQMEDNIKIQQDLIASHMQLTMTRSAPQTPKPSPRMEHLMSEVQRMNAEQNRLSELVDDLKNNIALEMRRLEEIYIKRPQKRANKTSDDSEEQWRSEQTSEPKQCHSSKRKNSAKGRHQGRNNTAAKAAAQSLTLENLKKLWELNMSTIREDQLRWLEQHSAVDANKTQQDTLRSVTVKLEELNNEVGELRIALTEKLKVISERGSSGILEARALNASCLAKLGELEASAAEERRRQLETMDKMVAYLRKFGTDSKEQHEQLNRKLTTLIGERSKMEKDCLMEREQRIPIDRERLEADQRLKAAKDAAQASIAQAAAAQKEAQKATAAAEAESDRLVQLQRIVEHEHCEREAELLAKTAELDQKLGSLCSVERRANEALHRVQAVERQSAARMHELQQRMHELGERETRLALERARMMQDRVDYSEICTCQQQQEQQREPHCTHHHKTDRKMDAVKQSGSTARKSIDQNTVPGNLCGAGDSVVAIAYEESTAATASAEAALAAAVQAEVSAITAKHHRLFRRHENNLVDELLDENIAGPYGRLQTSTRLGSDYWSGSTLHDDAKEQLSSAMPGVRSKCPTLSNAKKY